MFNPRTRWDQPTPASGLADSEATCSQPKPFHSSRAKLLQRNKLKERTRWPSPPPCPPLRAQHRPKPRHDTPAHWQRIAPICPPPTCRTPGFGEKTDIETERDGKKVNSGNLPALSCPQEQAQIAPPRQGAAGSAGAARPRPTQPGPPPSAAQWRRAHEGNELLLGQSASPPRPPFRAAAPLNPFPPAALSQPPSSHRGGPTRAPSALRAARQEADRPQPIPARTHLSAPTLFSPHPPSRRLGLLLSAPRRPHPGTDLTRPA